MPALQVIVRHTPGSRNRDRIWEWNQARWRAFLPSAMLTVASEASHDTVVRTELVGENLLFCDSDIAIDPHWVVEAHRRVYENEARCVVPTYHDLLTIEYSEWILEQDPRLIVEPTHMDLDWGNTNTGELMVVDLHEYGWNPKQDKLKGSAWHLNLG